jgi:flagellar L-ring protein precursor FlgH
MKKLLLSTAIILSLSACSAAERLSRVGQTPEFSDIENPVEQKGYKPVTMPMPEPQVEISQMNSLWSSNRQAFFEDQRADNVGDILTVVIDIENEAELDSSSSRSRAASDDAGINALGGFENYLDAKLLPDGGDPANLAGVTSGSSTNNSGSTGSEDDVELRIAAVVSQILPNGNMVIAGRQEVRVNFEKRILEIAGVIRPEDISIENSIPYDKIAEARIGYGGKGFISDVQQPRYGQQIFDILLPY